jgi:hypothetical protein
VEILDAAGFSADEVSALVERGVVGVRPAAE